ncbi:unnamed protein product, partial [Ectocarpus sp. 12 AP-2014]
GGGGGAPPPGDGLDGEAKPEAARGAVNGGDAGRSGEGGAAAAAVAEASGAEGQPRAIPGAGEDGGGGGGDVDGAIGPEPLGQEIEDVGDRVVEAVASGGHDADAAVGVGAPTQAGHADAASLRPEHGPGGGQGVSPPEAEGEVGATPPAEPVARPMPAAGVDDGSGGSRGGSDSKGVAEVEGAGVGSTGETPVSMNVEAAEAARVVVLTSAPQETLAPAASAEGGSSAAVPEGPEATRASGGSQPGSESDSGGMNDDDGVAAAAAAAAVVGTERELPEEEEEGKEDAGGAVDR